MQQKVTMRAPAYLLLAKHSKLTADRRYAEVPGCQSKSPRTLIYINTIALHPSHPVDLMDRSQRSGDSKRSSFSPSLLSSLIEDRADGRMTGGRSSTSSSRYRHCGLTYGSATKPHSDEEVFRWRPGGQIRLLRIDGLK